MNEEIFFIGLIAFVAITVCEVTILTDLAQLAVRTCRVPNSSFHQRRNNFCPLAWPADIHLKSLKNL